MGIRDREFDEMSFYTYTKNHPAPMDREEAVEAGVIGKPPEGKLSMNEEELEKIKSVLTGSASGEVRSVSETGGEKGVKPERYDLIPVEALAEVAKLYGRGAEKYDAHNWRRGYEWSKSYSALQRHANAFWNGEDIDPEMGVSHMACVVFHAMTLITFVKEARDYDDRYSTGRRDLP